MNAALSLKPLRQRSFSRALVTLMAVAVFLSSLAQAAHFHKAEAGRGVETHLQCLLCMHADRMAPPPVFAHAPTHFSVIARILQPVRVSFRGTLLRGFNARGPPLI